ncbi:hypothetical protein [Falsibacillus pallidus]|uniref:Lipoprotein n=1 Tax=Falsibacillus pallidus TaxID=493781 RepID=A0A370GSR7_9BACI|nr:hypothetical protein [Falsibacillus pallidus]RDI45564.1 hypothetical protein DFR59_102192 [Falsibacillus pallidus]
MKKIKVSWMVLVVMILASCSSSSVDNGMKGDKPPQVSIKIGSHIYATTLGSYCWSNKGKGECVDTAGPEKSLKGKAPIKVKPGEVISFVMDYEPKPNQFHLLQFHIKENLTRTISNNSFSAPEEKGVYYYGYSTGWMDEKDEHLSHGDATYYFVIEVE